MQKRGQITVFIIIGIVIVLVVALVLYATREQAVAPLEEERVEVAKVSAELRPVQDFVQTCLYTVAKDGLDIIGSRGGYLKPTQRYNPYEPTAGDAVQFAPDSELIIPYWWHMNSDNSCHGGCQFASERPGIEQIERQLDQYVAGELPKCLGTFEQFRKQQLIVTPTGAPQPETRITRGNVIVKLALPLDIAKNGEATPMREFVTELPVRFLELYTLGSNITSLQAEFSFLERATRALIDVFGRAEENALPPVTEMEFGFGIGTTWTEYDVQNRLAEMLTSYIPLLKVMNTRNYRFIPSPAGADKEFYEVMYNRGFTVPLLEQHRDVEVKFAYLPWWKPHLDLNCNGQLCQSDGFSTTLGPMFGVRRYTFAYDASYPVLVEVKSPDAYGGEGFTLRFFLEANMRNNVPVATAEPLPAVLLPEQNSMLCDADQRTGGNLTVNVRASSGEAVDKAHILFRCGTETCNLGESEAGLLKTTLPRCIGGFLSASHRRYGPAVKPLDVLDASDKAADLIMDSPYEVDFTVKKWLLKKQGVSWDLDTSAQEEQGPRENTVIMLARDGAPFEEPVTVFGEVCGSPFAKAPIPCGNPPSDTSKDVRLYAGRYHVTMYSFLYPSPDLQIPPDRRTVRYSVGPVRRTRHYWVPRNPIIFSTTKPLLSGYAEYDWTFTDDDLRNAKTIEFSYINFALDKVLPAQRRKIEDLEVMGNLFTYSEQYEELLRPRILR
jgi:hypothetical protein